MKPQERDELLIRLDERTEHTDELVEKQEKHLATLNERTAKSEMNIDRNHNRLTDIEGQLKEGLALKLSRKQVASGGVGIASVIVMVLVALGKTLGWW